jgi:hypothetical protein
VASNRQYNTYTGLYKGIKVSVTSPASVGQPLPLPSKNWSKWRQEFHPLGTGGMFQTWLPVPGIW